MCCLKCHRVIIISTKTAVHVKIRHPSDDESSETQQKKKKQFDRPINPFNYGEISEEDRTKRCFHAKPQSVAGEIAHCNVTMDN
jgi:hypothetical protein